MKKMQKKTLSFFKNFLLNWVIFFIIVLPIILISKSFYISYTDNIWSIEFFLFNFTNNIPFIGNKVYYMINGNIVTIDQLNINSIIDELLYSTTILTLISSNLYEMFYKDFIKIPMGLSNELLIKDIDDMFLAKGGDSVPGSPTRSLSPSRGVASGSVSPKSEGGSRSNTPEGVYGGNRFSEAEFEKALAENSKYGNLIMKYFYERFLIDYTKQANELKSINDVPMKITLDLPVNSKVDTDSKELTSELINIAMFQAEALMKISELRMDFVSRVDGFLPKDQIKLINKSIEAILEYRMEFLERIEKIQGSKSGENLKKLAREFYDNTNWFRKTGIKEFNYIDNIIRTRIRESHLYKNSPEFKKMIQIDYPLAVKSFNDQDNYLKLKINEALNKPKNIK